MNRLKIPKITFLFIILLFPGVCEAFHMSLKSGALDLTGHILNKDTN